MNHLKQQFSTILNDWNSLSSWFDGQIGKDLDAFLQERNQNGAIIYPPDPFNALRCTSLKDVQVVILGQDPYHGEGQAHGLSFSVLPGVKPPPSLVNIFKELRRTDPSLIFNSGCLTSWAHQGVLLLNTTLTVEKAQPFSHANKGWESFTDLIVSKVAQKEQRVAFLLWGGHAQSKEKLIRQYSKNHLILKSNHPSPLSAFKGPAPFLGNNHFKTLNEEGILINWST